MRALLITLALATLGTGCIGSESGEPPVVGIRNMYNQPRYDTQERQPFFADQRSMRPQVEGTVSREMEKGYSLATGLGAQSGEYMDTVPKRVIESFGTPEATMARGQERYNIFCAPCHSLSGDGKGMVSRRAAALGAAGLIAPSFHDDRLRHIPDGQLFAVYADPPGEGGVIDMLARDTDGDGAPNAWEDAYGLDRNDPRDGAADLDRDGMTGADEFVPDLIVFDRSVATDDRRFTAVPHLVVEILSTDPLSPASPRPDVRGQQRLDQKVVRRRVVAPRRSVAVLDVELDPADRLTGHEPRRPVLDDVRPGVREL